MPAVSDAKEANLLATLGLTAPTSLTDLEWQFYSVNSGLTPASKYSITDHKLAFYKLNGALGASIAEVEKSYFSLSGAVGSSYDDLALDFYRNSGFGPKSIQGLALWLDSANVNGSNNTGLVDGQAISQWNDISGNGHHAIQVTGANQPLFKVTQTPTGKPAISFDGVNDILTEATLATGAGAATVFIVAAKSTSGTTGMVLNDSNANVANGYGTYADTNWHFENGGTATAVGPAVDTNWHVFVNLALSANAQGAVDGVLTGSLASNSTVGFAGYRLGANRGGTAFLNGKIAAVLIYNRNLTTAERQRVERYLKNRFGTP